MWCAICYVRTPRVAGKASWPIHKALLDLRRACRECAEAAPLMTQAELRTTFLCMKVELGERDIEQLFSRLARPEDNGLLRVEALCRELEESQLDHPLSKSPSKRLQSHDIYRQM